MKRPLTTWIEAEPAPDDGDTVHAMATVIELRGAPVPDSELIPILSWAGFTASEINKHLDAAKEAAGFGGHHE